jgi:hypothetical protein
MECKPVLVFRRLPPVDPDVNESAYSIPPLRSSPPRQDRVSLRRSRQVELRHDLFRRHPFDATFTTNVVRGGINYKF